MDEPDDYGQFIKQEKQYISTIGSLCPDYKHAVYLGMRWRTMDDDERQLYKLLAYSNSNNKAKTIHSLKEILINNNDDNVTNNNKPVVIPMKRLNINNELFEYLSLTIKDNNDNNDNKPKKKRGRKRKVQNTSVSPPPPPPPPIPSSSSSSSSYLKKTKAFLTSDDEIDNNYDEPVTFHYDKEVDQSDITDLLSLANNNNNNSNINANNANNKSSSSNNNNDNNNSNKQYSVDETDISKLLLGLKN